MAPGAADPERSATSAFNSDRSSETIRALAGACSSPIRTLRHELRLVAGEMLLVHNWRVLHGRTALDGRRDMACGSVNREDVESTARRLEA